MNYNVFYFLSSVVSFLIGLLVQRYYCFSYMQEISVKLNKINSEKSQIWLFGFFRTFADELITGAHAQGNSISHRTVQ